MRPMMLLVVLAACGSAPAPATPAAPASTPASPAPTPVVSATWEMPNGHKLTQEDGAILRAEGFPLTEALVGAPSWDTKGLNVVFAEKAKSGGKDSSQLVLAEQRASGWSRKVVVQADSAPNLPSIAPDGTAVAYVATGPLGGSPGIWLVTIASGEQVPLTNAELSFDGAAAPSQVPVPDTAPKFDGVTVSWTAKDGPHSVAAKP